MAPMRWYLMRFATHKRKQALAKSTVKITGNDVVASWKILLGLFLVPGVINLTTLLFYFFRSHIYASSTTGRISASLFFSVCLCGYLVYCVQLLNGVKTNLRIVMIRFFVIIYRKRIANLRAVRKDLKRQVRQVMDKYSKLNQHTLIKRRSLHISDSLLDIDIDADEIFGNLKDIMFR